MRIVFLAAGSGDNFYCENCLRDMDLVRSLRGKALDVIMVPLYLPLPVQGSDLVEAPVFFGGINVFLQQMFGLFRHTPRWLDRVFDSRMLLKWVSKRARMTNARALGQATVSMLLGPAGRQAKELDRLLDWLSGADGRADVICLSNALLLGLAQPIKERLGIPVVCLLQDEDGFVDALPRPYGDQAWALMRSKVGSVACFIAVSRYYADLMQERLEIPSDRVFVVPMGVFPDHYRPAASASKVPTIGYLSRLCRFHGLDLLVDAFIDLKQLPGLGGLQMRWCGGQEPGDEVFVMGLMSKIRGLGFEKDVVIWPSFGLEQRTAFLDGITVLAVPESRPVAAARYVLEALACGVPVVGPAFGVFPELRQSTGGLVLYEGNTKEALAGVLEGLLRDRQMAFELGQKGRAALLAGLTIEHTAGRFLDICSRLVDHYLLPKE